MRVCVWVGRSSAMTTTAKNVEEDGPTHHRQAFLFHQNGKTVSTLHEWMSLLALCVYVCASKYDVVVVGFRPDVQFTSAAGINLGWSEIGCSDWLIVEFNDGEFWILDIF